MNKKVISIGLILLILVPSVALARKITRPTVRAVYHNNQGVKYLNVGQLELAEVEFKTAVELSPDYSEAYNNLGIVAKKKGQVRDSIAYFEKALELDKNYAAAYSHLSMAYLDLGDLNKALSLGKIATKKGSTLPITHYNYGLVFLEKNNQNPDKNYSEYAEKELKIATELNPNMHEAHLTLARLYRENGKYELSAIRYRLALENHPEQPKVWAELGEVYRTMGDMAKAENAFQKGIAISAQKITSTDPHMQLGIQYMNQKNFPKAISEFKEAIKTNPKSEIAYYRLGTSYLYLGENSKAKGKGKEANRYFKSAKSNLKKALKLNPQYADASYNLGLVYYQSGDSNTAESQWISTLSIDQNHGRALYNLGMIYNVKGDKANAQKYLCRFIKTARPEFSSQKGAAVKTIKAIGASCRN